MGKISKRSDGRYQARVWTGEYRDCKRVYTVLYDKSKRELEKKVIEYETKKATGQLVQKAKTDLYNYSLQWLDLSKGLKEKRTYNFYYDVITVHLKDFNGLEITDYNYTLIQNIINDNREHPRTCEKIKLTLKQIGESAESDKLLPRGTTQEIFKRVVLPKKVKKEKRALYPEEKDAILKADFSPMERAFVYTIYFTGMRKEEALALTKSDIGDVITINKAVGQDHGKPYLKGTKSERGVRTVPIPSQLKAVLDEYLKDKKPDDLLFTFNGGLAIESSYGSFWARIRKKMYKVYPNAENGFTDLTAHLFRHNYCTQLCYQSANGHTITTKKIAELLGDSEQMVIEVYSHIIAEYEKVEESIENALKL